MKKHEDETVEYDISDEQLCSISREGWNAIEQRKKKKLLENLTVDFKQ